MPLSYKHTDIHTTYIRYNLPCLLKKDLALSDSPLLPLPPLPPPPPSPIHPFVFPELKAARKACIWCFKRYSRKECWVCINSKDRWHSVSGRGGRPNLAHWWELFWTLTDWMRARRKPKAREIERNKIDNDVVFTKHWLQRPPPNTSLVGTE